MQVEDFEREAIILYSNFSQEILTIKRNILTLPKSVLMESVIVTNGEADSEFPIDHQLFSGEGSCNAPILIIPPESIYNGDYVTVSYLLRELTWVPSYLMVVDEGGVVSFQGIATIRNNTQGSIRSKSLLLAAGDVEPSHYGNMAFAVSQSEYSSQRSIKSKIQVPDTDYYEISSRRLENGTTQFSFLGSDAISLDRSQKFYYVDVHPGQAKELAQKTYEIYAQEYLPGGSVIAYGPDRRLVGMSSLPTIPAKSWDSISFGTANRVYAEYQCTETRTSETQLEVRIEGKVTNMTGASIRLKFRYPLSGGRYLSSPSQGFVTVGEFLEWGAPITSGTQPFKVQFTLHSPNLNFR